MLNLWASNHPRLFWQCQPDPPEEVWREVIADALPTLGLAFASTDMDSLLALTLGEARFGPDHWRLSLPKQMYYLLKPILPRALTRVMRRIYQRVPDTDSASQWYVESRYVSFLWEVLARVIELTDSGEVFIKPIWREGQRFAFVLTHDVESYHGLRHVREVADLEESFGFRSSFNFVPEAYPIDTNLLDELTRRGFEVGIHGLKHDGKLFSSRSEFKRRATRINRYLKELGAVGFRAPLTHRHPEWMQSLDIEYDLSFFDIDPFEPIPGGTMSVYPFFLGRFVELPYTLIQDYTLTAVLNEKSPRIWLDKVSFIEKFHGMALVNSHPDYLHDPANLMIYSTFLSTMKERDGYWHALPRDVARWWRDRATVTPSDSLTSVVRLVDGIMQIDTYEVNQMMALR